MNVNGVPQSGQNERNRSAHRSSRGRPVVKRMPTSRMARHCSGDNPNNDSG